jgi:hypothetical protein
MRPPRNTRPKKISAQADENKKFIEWIKSVLHSPKVDESALLAESRPLGRGARALKVGSSPPEHLHLGMKQTSARRHLAGAVGVTRTRSGFRSSAINRPISTLSLSTDGSRLYCFARFIAHGQRVWPDSQMNLLRFVTDVTICYTFGKSSVARTHGFWPPIG